MIIQLWATKIMVWFLFLGKKDKSGKPYYRHLKAVGDRSLKGKARIVGYLHDLLEDTALTEDFLHKHYSEEVVDAVVLLTRREDTDLSQYYRKIKENPLAREVKINDLIHNSSLCRIHRLTRKDIERTRQYLEYLDFLFTGG